MAKVKSLTEALDKYKGNGGGDFFTLTNDKDLATVRFLHGSMEDLEALDNIFFVVHEVEIAGKNRYVHCEQGDDCPLCLAGNVAKLRGFLQLIDKKDGKHKIWERGKQFIPKLVGIIERKGPLWNRQYEIERNGKKGDTQTTYELYDFEKDDKQLSDLPEPLVLLGKDTLILQKSYDEMRAILNGTAAAPAAPASGNAGNSGSSRTSRTEEPAPQREATPRRATTPSGGSNTDVF